MDKAREVALKVLYKIDKENAYSNIILNEEINKNKEKLNSKDISLISEIIYGVTTWRLTIDEIIKKYSKIRIKKISPWILNILRMSIYQIIFLDKIPKSAAVNEGVNLAKKYGGKSTGFTNAILRKVTKNDYEEILKSKNKDNLESISKAYSMPMWIIEELKKENFDNEKIETICKNSNIRPKITIRVNNLKTDIKKLREKLENKGFEVNEGILKDFLILNKLGSIEKLEEFKDGLFTIQDEVAGLSSLVLDPKENEIVLDACSSPGGKTTYLAQIMNNRGKIIAWDIHENRTKLVNNTAKRLGINIITTNTKDATIYDEFYKEKFDKILLDVPCLGLGVLKRKPDIKWQRKKEDIEEITNTQYKILETCSKYLKNGGELVYSTCSIFNSENADIINKFLKNNSEFKIEKIDKILIEDENENCKMFFENYLKNDEFLQVYQNEKTDGFFICKLIKIPRK